MSVIKVTLPVGEIPVSGKQISFTAPCSCKDTEALEIDGARYTVVDALCRPVTGVGGRWDVGAIVSVILDTDKKCAFYQNSWTPTAADVGAVPTTRKVNGKALSSDISLVATDVGARPNTWMPTATDVGARPNTWMPTAADVGAMVEYNCKKDLSAKGWYRIGWFNSKVHGNQALVILGNGYISGDGKPNGVVALVTPNTNKPSIVVLSANQATAFTNIRIVPTGSVSLAIEVYYALDKSNPVALRVIPTTASGTFTFGELAATTSTEDALLTQSLTTIPSGSVLTSGNSYKDIGFFPRFKKDLTANDNLDDFKEDGIIVYNTNDAPANAPFPNASVGICFGSNDTTRQRIQIVGRYGVAGEMKFRTYTGSKWLEWADFFTSLRKPTVADIADGNNLARIETGSYVGTGTNGVDHPTEITFSFVPKMVWVWMNPYPYIHGIGSSGSGYMIPCASLTNKYSYAAYLPHASNSWQNKLDGTTLSFYCGSESEDEDTGEIWYPDADVQLNSSGVTYYYIGIG